ncbi:hypothetical protein Bca101_015281 [Brassica carinata]
MGNVEEYKPVMAMMRLQLCYAGVTLSARATLVNGTSPRHYNESKHVLRRYETVNIRNIRGLAKISGTVLCVVGAISMTLLRGPKILNSESTLPIENSLIGDLTDQSMWLIGCSCVFASTLCYSLWLTFQGIVSSALAFTVQAWVISKRGPLFSAMFNPLCTVIVTILASLILQEEMFTGSLIGGICVIMGLYIVLWGKAEDVMINQEQRDNSNNSDVKIPIEDSSNIKNSNRDLKNPLLS